MIGKPVHELTESECRIDLLEARMFIGRLEMVQLEHLRLLQQKYKDEQSLLKQIQEIKHAKTLPANEELINEVNALKARGFWARVFNLNPK